MVSQKIGRSGGSLLDYEEALYFGDCEYASVSRFYVAIERILAIEWFIKQLGFRASDVIEFDHAVECGLLYFIDDPQEARIKAQLKRDSDSNSKT